MAEPPDLRHRLATLLALAWRPFLSHWAIFALLFVAPSAVRLLTGPGKSVVPAGDRWEAFFWGAIPLMGAAAVVAAVWVTLQHWRTAFRAPTGTVADRMDVARTIATARTKGVEAAAVEQANDLGVEVPTAPAPELRPRPSRTEWKAKRDAARTARIAKEQAAAAARADHHKRRLVTEIPYVGTGVSGGLQPAESDVARLTAAGLPIISSASDLAALLGVDVRRLHWMCHHRPADTGSHYRYFEVPKRRGGGRRLLCAPKPALRSAQRKLLAEVLAKVVAHPAAHGFVPGRSILTNAKEHVGRKVVVNLDLRDFFPSVTYPRVKGMFVSLGYSEPAATLMGLLCTESPRKRVTLPTAPPGLRRPGPAPTPTKSVAPEEAERAAAVAGGPVVLWVAAGDRQLPQGAPTSPAVTNIVCRRLDKRLAELAGKLGWNYTRYADDLTFSAAGEDPNVGRIIKEAGRIVEFEGFRVHPEKVRVQWAGRRQSVTGLTVNDKPGVSRAEKRRLRAAIHRAGKRGPAAVVSAGAAPGTDVAAHLRGRAAFVHMTDPALGRRMLSALAGVATGTRFPEVRPGGESAQTPSAGLVSLDKNSG